MNILPINNSTNTNFNGRVLVKGNCTEYLERNFLNLPEVKKLASGKYDIIGKFLYRKAHWLYDKRHYPGEDTYKLKLIAQKENPTFLDRIKGFLGLNPSVEVTRSYHCEGTTELLMRQRINCDKYKTRLKINS